MPAVLRFRAGSVAGLRPPRRVAPAMKTPQPEDKFQRCLLWARAVRKSRNPPSVPNWTKRIR